MLKPVMIVLGLDAETATPEPTFEDPAPPAQRNFRSLRTVFVARGGERDETNTRVHIRHAGCVGSGLALAAQAHGHPRSRGLGDRARGWDTVGTVCSDPACAQGVGARDDDAAGTAAPGVSLAVGFQQPDRA